LLAFVAFVRFVFQNEGIKGNEGNKAAVLTDLKLRNSEFWNSRIQ